MLPDIIYNWLREKLLQLTDLAGDHHGGCLFPVLTISVPLSMLIFGFSIHLLPGWMIFLAIVAAIFYVVGSQLISSPQFQLFSPNHLTEEKRWAELLFVLVWFLCFLVLWLFGMWVLYQMMRPE